VPWPEFLRWHVRQSLRAMGAATEMDLRNYMSFPRVPVPKRRQALESLLKSGEVVELAVEGDKARWFALADDVPQIRAAGRKRRVANGTTLLSPFDSFLWHRDRINRLLGYDYRVEIYTPGHKRVHGYYSLPIYHDGALIGRLDAKNHRAERRLEVRNVHFEPWFVRRADPPGAAWGRPDRDAGLAGTALALASLARFVGAERVSHTGIGRARLGRDLAAAIDEVVAFDRPRRGARPTSTTR